MLGFIPDPLAGIGNLQQREGKGENVRGWEKKRRRKESKGKRKEKGTEQRGRERGRKKGNVME